MKKARWIGSGATTVTTTEAKHVSRVRHDRDADSRLHPLRRRTGRVDQQVASLYKDSAWLDKPVADEAFFKGTSWKSNFVCNLGCGDQAKLHPRFPRLEFNEACRIV